MKTPEIGFRPEFLKTPILYGKEITLKMPNGESRKGQFAIVELDNILASHNEKSYGNTDGYPLDANGENVNDRNYTGDVASQAKIVEFAQNLEPERLIVTSRTPSGTPIISVDGIVVSGNNRTMSLKLAVTDFPEKYNEYKEFLADEFYSFGFDEKDKIGEHGIKYFSHPVIIRFDYDFPAYNTLELSKYNKETKKSERPIDKALKLGKILESSERCTSVISDVVGQYETFTEFYANRADQKKIKETLVDCNILTSQEMPAYYSEAGFTEQGKELIENLLAGLVLSKDALIASNEGGARTFRQTIITSLPILTANKNLGTESLNNALNEAILIQSQMSAGKISFYDFISQTNMFGDKPSEEGMYINRLLLSGRNNFKRSIEAYNSSVAENQGESLFGDKPTKEEIFDIHIKNKIDSKDKELIDKALKNTEGSEPSKPKQTMEKTISNPFINGNFFKEKPENILAKTTTGTDRWKKTITEYKGSLEDIARIDAPLTFLTANEAEQPLISVIEESVFTSTENNTQLVDNLQKAVEVSKKEEPKKQGRKKKTANVVESAESLTESYSIREVYDMLNPEISLDELRAFMWWKNKKGRPIESQEWLDIAGMTADELYNSEWLVKEWVENGVLYYFDGELLPAYLYLAENVYDKKTRLIAVKETEEGQTAASGQDAEYIIKTYGKEVFDNQVKALDSVYRVQYEKRLTISGPENDAGLIINPVSKFAKKFTIKTLVDEAPFKWKKITAGSNKNYGKPDFLETYVADRDKATFDELSLTDAFCYWLRTDDTIQYQKGMNYADIIKIYIQHKSKPATQASKDENGHFTGSQLTLKKKEDAEWERLKSKAKTEGDRLFLVFLDKQLTANDKIKIETQWNRDYNGYVKINYNKVPVAFPCNRFDMGKPLEIKPEKREAVAFTFSEGSGLLAYDVGVGKANLLTSNILTPKGWVKMGDIKEGDFVIGKNGKPTKVVGVFPQGKRQSYKVTFSDGSYTEVTDEHLWDVQTINYRSKYPNKWDTVRTMDIKDELYNYRGDYQYSIPMVAPVHFDEQDVPLAPYLLGALLGDGGLSENGVNFSNPEKDIQERIKSLLPEGVKLVPKNDDELNFRLSVKLGQKNPLIEALTSLKLMGTKSNSKFVPDCYKFNTPAVRQEVLCGLIDTDGYIKTDKGLKQGCTVQYTTVSKQLCDDVKFLVQSFGGTVIVNSKYPQFTHKGEKKTGQLAYTLSIRLPKGILPVSSKKQLEKFVEKTKYQPIRFIQSIEDIGMHEAQCIRVEAEDHLYVCDEFIVTHNTPSAIFTVCQFLATGYSKRPLLVVPNQTYKQWISEFKKFANHIRINEFYNLSKDYMDDWKDVNGVTKKVAEGSVSIITYEGMKQLGFTEDTTKELAPEIASILMQEQKEGTTAKKADRELEKLNSKVEEIIGKALSKSVVNVEDLGFDFISFDEAHACKKVFTFVKGEKEENHGNSGKETKSVSRYEIKSGEPSFNGVKGFMLCQYIQKKFNGNTLLLTATPFTNSPLEVYSMLAMVAHNKLKQMALDNLATFFDTFVAISYEMIINSRLKPERRQVIMGFNNLISLQTLVRRFINYKTGEEVKVPRPNKIVLPLRTKMINGIKVNLSDSEKVETILPLTDVQSDLMTKIKQYADGNISEGAMCTGSLIEEEENEDAAVAAGVEIDEDSMDADEKIGVRLLKAMNHARNLALSPYIFECSGLGAPTAEKYINTSNKLRYVMEAVRTIKQYHEKEGTDMSGVVIYMDRGVQYFSLIREYLIKNVGFAEHEVGIISSKLIVPVPKGTPKEEQKEYVKNLFLGDRFNKDTLEMEKLTPNERCKVIIGSSTIKEGINLQKHSSVLFNCWMDWNPTDIQQLEGRIYRQGNKFKTVRIVNPLMIDSMDIFMFQKLEEKTSRINTIWQNDGRTNVLKTEEFNPKDLKYSLIKDASVLAQMELMEVGEKIEEDIADLENQIKRNKKIIGYDKTLADRTEDLEEWLEEYRPLNEGQPKRPLEAMLRLAQEVLKNQTDSQGKKMEYRWQRNAKKEAEGFYSDLSPASKPWWFDDLNFANRNLKREQRDYLAPKGVEIKDLEGYSKKLEEQIAALKEQKQKVVSEDAIKIKAQEINEIREANKVEEKTVDQCVTDFKKLNYLLSELVVPDKKIEIKLPCPPVDENGNVRTDADGLALLDICIENDPDTKRMHTDANGDYTPERKELHKRIIKELTGEAICTERGKPIAILTGGAPGSGKSTFLNKYAPYLQSNYIWKIDADAVREYLPEYKGWNSASTHQETRDIVNSLLDSFDKPCKHDLLYDGTMSNSAKYIPLIGKLKKMGYLVFIAYMDVPKEVSVQRAMSRYASNKGGKTQYGRYVPMSVIDDFFKTGKEGYNEIKNAVDGYILVDSMTQKIIEKGGMDIPQDRDYKEMFEKGKEKDFAPIQPKPNKAMLETRLKLLKKMVVKKATATLKTRIKIVEKMLAGKFAGGGPIPTSDVWETKNTSVGPEGSVGVILHNGNTVGKYEFDRDSDAFWISESGQSGQKSFDTKEEMINYFKGKFKTGGKVGCGCAHKAQYGEKVLKLQVQKLGDSFAVTKGDRVAIETNGKTIFRTENEAKAALNHQLDLKYNSWKQVAAKGIKVGSKQDKKIKEIIDYAISVKKEDNEEELVELVSKKFKGDSMHTGGGFYVALIRLDNNTVLGVNGELIVKYTVNNGKGMGSWDIFEDESAIENATVEFDFTNMLGKESVDLFVSDKTIQVLSTESLPGKYVNIYRLGVPQPSAYKIISAKITPETFEHRNVTLTFDGDTQEVFPIRDYTKFIAGEQIKIKDSSGEPYLLELIS